MKAIEYTANISENGVLPLPPEILKQLNIKKIKKVKILLLYDEKNEKKLEKYCGKWRDNKSAQDIVKEIFSERQKNIRSEGSHF